MCILFDNYRLQNKREEEGGEGGGLNENILKERLKGFFENQKRKLSTKKKNVCNLNI